MIGIPDLKTPLIYVLAGACVLLGVHSCTSNLRMERAQTSLATLEGKVRVQKDEAAATLRTLNATVLAQQKVLDQRRTEQEQTDAQNQKTVDAGTAELQRSLVDGRLRVAGGCGPGGGGATGATAAGGQRGAGHASETPGYFQREFLRALSGF